jgi:hypothetical protein
VTYKQLEYEFELLKWKLEKRNKNISLKDVKIIEINEVFTKTEGNIEKWEKPIQEILNRMDKKD